MNAPSTTGTPAHDAGSVVTLGETMALLSVPGGRSLRTGSCLPVGIGGAESNVAIGLARLGVPCTWISRVGADSFGDLVVREIRAEGVRVIARRDDIAPTGMMAKEHRGGRPRQVRYYRSNSAASLLSPDDLDEDAIAGADVLHLTGITAALGEFPLRTMQQAIEIAREAGTLVSLDVNYRSTLWSPDRAGPVLADLAAAADLVFAGPEEAELLLGRPHTAQIAPDFDEGEQLARGLAKLGPATVVVKLSALGALGLAGDQVHRASAAPITVVDVVGAGDAFVAGFLSEFVAGKDLSTCLRVGNLVGGAVCQEPGDWEGLPTREELFATVDSDEIIR